MGEIEPGRGTVLILGMGFGDRNLSLSGRLRKLVIGLSVRNAFTSKACGSFYGSIHIPGTISQCLRWDERPSASHQARSTATFRRPKAGTIAFRNDRNDTIVSVGCKCSHSWTSEDLFPVLGRCNREISTRGIGMDVPLEILIEQLIHGRFRTTCEVELLVRLWLSNDVLEARVSARSR